jgi:apolipoprotein N-acyltransferase
LWLAGCVYWLLAVHWIRLPLPLNYLGWAALAGYLGVYLPGFVVLARTGVHRLRLPLFLAAPVVWTGLDLVRAHLMTGFLMASLAHTQYRNPNLIQIADIFGEYGVTFLIMLVAASVTQTSSAFFLNQKTQLRLWRKLIPLVTAAVLLGFALVHGRSTMLNHALQTNVPRGSRIALIQGNTLADWKSDPEKQQQIMQEYLRVSLDAVRTSQQRDGRAVDLVVWPETAFRQTLVSVPEGYTLPESRIHKSFLTAAQTDLTELVRQVGCAALVGIDRVELMPSEGDDIQYRSYNSSVLVDKEGHIQATYDKMHLVPFGEFIPLAEWFPVLYRLTPISGGAEPGTSAAVMGVNDLFLSPNICYESAVPHLIRKQLNQLGGQSIWPNALVNLTNDAWFWGSSELDLHLACAVFRAVENRTPWLIAANGGLSAHIDAAGIIRQVTPRQQTAFLLVDLQSSHGFVWYHSLGDWLAGLCLVCCVALAIVTVRNRTSRRGRGRPGSPHIPNTRA